MRTAGLAPILLLTLGLALWQLLPRLVVCVAHRFDPPTWAGQTPELDAWLIHQGLLEAPRFVDTLQWWSGPWVGQVPFYRPLSSYVFWLEWQAFGEQESLYGLPAAAAHVGAALLFTAFVYRLARRSGVRWPEIAALVAAGGFLGLLWPHRQDVIGRILVWKNQPDSLAAACCFASLLFYLRAQEGQRTALVGAGAWYLAACGFKEIAVPLPLVCMAMEAHSLRQQPLAAASRRIAAMVAVGALFLAVRELAIQGVGYTYGTNRAWLPRTLVHLVGPFEPMVVHGQWLGNLLGLWTYLVALLTLWLVWRRRKSAICADAAGLRYALAAPGLILLGWVSLGGLSASQSPYGHPSVSPELLLTGLLLCFQPVPLTTALGTVAFLLAVTLVYRQCRSILGLGLVWTVAFLLPLTFSSGPIHRYYLPQAGFLLVYAFAAAGLWRAMAERLQWPLRRQTV